LTDPDGHRGVNRARLTHNDRKSRRLLIAWAEQAGLAVTGDKLGDSFLRFERSDPTLGPCSPAAIWTASPISMTSGA